MPLGRIEWNRVLVIQLVILAGIALLYIALQLLDHVSHLIQLVAAAAAIAMLVAPIARRLNSRIENRVLSTGLVYLGVLVSVGIALTVIAVPLVGEARNFAIDLPGRVSQLPDLATTVDSIAAGYGVQLQLADLAIEAEKELQAAGSLVLGGTIGVAASLASSLADVVLTLVLSFYFSVDGPRLRDQGLKRIPDQWRPEALRIERSIRRVFGGYVRGQIILGFAIGIMAGIGALIFRLPYPIVLGVLAGVFELIPMFGSLLGAVPSIVVALFQPFPTVIWVVIYFIAVNQFESYILAPRVTGEAIGLSPLGALLALLLGVQLAGFVGALVAIPVAAVLVELLNTAPVVEPEAGETG